MLPQKSCFIEDNMHSVCIDSVDEEDFCDHEARADLELAAAHC